MNGCDGSHQAELGLQHEPGQVSEEMTPLQSTSSSEPSANTNQQHQHGEYWKHMTNTVHGHMEPRTSVAPNAVHFVQDCSKD